jgi:hypothetical protein
MISSVAKPTASSIFSVPQSNFANETHFKGAAADGCSAARFCLPVIQLKSDFADVPTRLPNGLIGEQTPAPHPLAFVEEIDEQVDLVRSTPNQLRGVSDLAYSFADHPPKARSVRQPFQIFCKHEFSRSGA